MAVFGRRVGRINDPKGLIAAKRIFLLILGILGGASAGVVLWFLAISGGEQNALPPASTEIIWELTDHAAQSFPITIQNTTVQMQRISAYDGPFLEDGSDREVVNVAALHILNTGSEPILKVGIILRLHTETYVFYGAYIPPGIPVVLLEQSAKPYCKDTVSDCSGWQITASAQALEGISVQESETGVLMITNHSQNTYLNVALYHKSWLSPPDVYVGGIAYKTTIPKLLPGQTEYLRPAHYAPGYSRLVCVTADTGAP